MFAKTSNIFSGQQTYLKNARRSFIFPFVVEFVKLKCKGELREFPSASSVTRD
jgi:hypothetical protein